MRVWVQQIEQLKYIVFLRLDFCEAPISQCPPKIIIFVWIQGILKSIIISLNKQKRELSQLMSYITIGNEMTK